MKLSEREEYIYKRLQDEESRKVFDARRHFLKTKDFTRFSDVFVNNKQLADVVRRLRGKTYVIYCMAFAGGVLETYFDSVGLSGCLGVWDNNPGLHGKKRGKNSISAPNYELLDEIDIFLISTSSEANVTSVIQDLTSHGVALHDILTVDPFGCALGRCGHETEAQYFDCDIIIPRLSKNEVFVDAGCCNFSTSARLLELVTDAQRIYAFEPDHENIQLVLQGIERNNAQHIVKLYDFALWSSNEELAFWVSDFEKGGSCVAAGRSNTNVSGRKLDEIVLPEDIVTFIKMDIEGAELEALRGAADIIKRDKPKLAISIYHKETDYVDIAEYILSLVSDYKLYMRQYTPINLETVLYCVHPLY